MHAASTSVDAVPTSGRGIGCDASNAPLTEGRTGELEHVRLWRRVSGAGVARNGGQARIECVPDRPVRHRAVTEALGRHLVRRCPADGSAPDCTCPRVLGMTIMSTPSLYESGRPRKRAEVDEEVQIEAQREQQPRSIRPAHHGGPPRRHNRVEARMASRCSCYEDHRRRAGSGARRVERTAFRIGEPDRCVEALHGLGPRPRDRCAPPMIPIGSHVGVLVGRRRGWLARHEKRHRSWTVESERRETALLLNDDDGKVCAQQSAHLTSSGRLPQFAGGLR